MKKIVLLFLLSLSLLSFSCGKKSSNLTTIEFWTLQLRPMFDEYMTSLIDKYEAEHPDIKIKWVDIPFNAATQKLMSAAASGQAPDLINLSADFLPKMAEMGVLEDLSGILPDSTKDKYVQGALEASRFQNKLYAVPWYLSTYIAIYNANLFQKAGFQPDEVPHTYSQFLEFAKKYKKNTGDFGIYYNIAEESFLIQTLKSEGIPLFNQDGTEALVNSPEAVKLIDQWVQAYRNGYLPRNSVTNGHRTAIESYQSGQVALIIGGPQFLKLIRESAPSIYKVTDIAPALVGKTGAHDLATMDLAVSTDSEHPKEALQFALYVTNAANQIAFARKVVVLPSVTKALDDPYFQEGGESLEAEARKIAAQQLKDARQLKPAPLLHDYSRMMEIFRDGIQNACFGEETTQQAMNKVAREWNSILQQNSDS